MSGFSTARQKMVDGQVRPSDVTDIRILDAMLAVPREAFVPASQRALAYLDLDLDVSEGARSANARTAATSARPELYDVLAALAARRGYGALLSGANADDAGDWRPGLRAAAEHGVRHPLLEAGAGKARCARSRAARHPQRHSPPRPAWPRASPTARRWSRQTLARIDRAGGPCARSASPCCACATTGSSAASRSPPRTSSARSRASPSWSAQCGRGLRARRHRPRAVPLRPPQRGPWPRRLPAMIERAPFGATGHDSSRAIFGAAALGQRHQGRRRPRARAAARARRQPHRRRRELRRRRAAHRAVAAPPPGHVLRRHQDRRAQLRAPRARRSAARSTASASTRST